MPDLRDFEAARQKKIEKELRRQKEAEQNAAEASGFLSGGLGGSIGGFFSAIKNKLASIGQVVGGLFVATQLSPTGAIAIGILTVAVAVITLWSIYKWMTKGDKGAKDDAVEPEKLVDPLEGDPSNPAYAPGHNVAQAPGGDTPSDDGEPRLGESNRI